MSSRSQYIVPILLFCSFTLFAQEPPENMLLTQLISKWEKTFDVKFSYAARDLEGIEIPVPGSVLSLEEGIEYLHIHTYVVATRLNDRYIALTLTPVKLSVCGIVREAATKNPVPGAALQVVNQKKGTVTDAKGYFFLEGLSPDDRIRCTHLGFSPYVIQINRKLLPKGDCLEIFLEESNEWLNEVVISELTTTGLVARRDGSIRLTSADFGILPGQIEPDVLQSVQTLPGVESINETVAAINVRGGSQDQNNILWDGIRMYHTGHFFGLISAYNPYLTESITVIKNGTSSEFSEGISSTLAMNTRNELAGEISGGAGVNLLSADAFIEIPLSAKASLQLSGRHSLTGWFRSPTYERYSQRSFQDTEIQFSTSPETGRDNRSDFRFSDYSGKILFDLNERHKVRVQFLHIGNALDYEETETGNDSGIVKSSMLSQRNRAFGGHWNTEWNHRLQTLVQAYYSHYTIDSEDFRHDTEQALTRRNEVLETGMKLKARYTPGSGLQLTGGYQFTETGILNRTTVRLPEYSETRKDVLRNHALFSEAAYSYGKIYVRGGLRFHYFEKFRSYLSEPRVSLRYQPGNYIGIKALGEYKHQTTTQIVDRENDFLGVEKRRWRLANNDDIPIVKSRQGSLGADYKKGGFYADLTGFYKIVTGITTRGQGFHNSLFFENTTGNYTARGLEYFMSQKWDSARVWVSYTLSDNSYSFNETEPSRFPNNTDIRHSFAGAASVALTRGLWATVGYKWHSGLPYTRPVQGNEILLSENGTPLVHFEEPNGTRLPPYQRWDASVTYRLKTGKTQLLEIGCSVLNLLNTRNVIERYYVPDPEDPDRALPVEIRSLGITPNANVRFRF